MKEYRKSPVLKKIKQRLQKKHWREEASKIATRVLFTLTKKGMTQKDLAKKLDKSPQWINKICQGKQNLTIGTIKELESALGITLFEIPDLKEDSITYQ